MSDYRGGYKTEVARYKIAPYERKHFEEYIKTHDLVDLAERIDRGEPHEVNPNYGGQGYTYLYPEVVDLGRVKVALIDNKWKLDWENNRDGQPHNYVLDQKNKQESRAGEDREKYVKDNPRHITRSMLRK